MQIKIKSKYDYRKYKRSDVHTTVREDIYTDWQILSVKLRQPSTKMLDIALEMILKDEVLLNEFKNKLRLY